MERVDLNEELANEKSVIRKSSITNMLQVSDRVANICHGAEHDKQITP